MDYVCKLQRTVLKGEITGCNIRCFCVKCDGSKVSTPSLQKEKYRLVLTPISVSRCIAQTVHLMLFSFWMLQAISTYIFEQHAGSSAKHPTDYIYLANGNSLRDVIHAAVRSPLESLDKTIRSSIDPMSIRSRTNCLNCNGETSVLR